MRSPRFCDTCLASLGKGTHPAMSGRNYSLAAAWWLTRLNHEAYVEKESGPLSPYMNIEGFKIESVVYDLMHNIFLGIGRDLFASGLKLLICKNVWEHLGEDWDTILAGIHLEMHQTCAAYGFLAQFGYVFLFSPRLQTQSCWIPWLMAAACCSMLQQLRFYLPRKPVLTLSSLNGDGDEFSELSTRYKASHVRLMIFWLAKKSQEAADSNQNDADLQVLASCCYGLQRSIEIQTHGDLILEQDEASEASRCVYLFVACYAWLALKCCDAALLMFKCRPKLHYLLHTGQDIERLRLNQLKLFSTFTEESFLGRLKSIACQVHGKTLTTRVFQRYILTLAVALHQFKMQMFDDTA